MPVKKKTDSKEFWKGLLLLLSSILIIAFLIGFISSQPTSFSGSSGTLAIVEVKGVITTTGSSDVLGRLQGASADRIITRLEDVCEQPSIDAVFLEINSPGGELTASNRLKFAVEDCNKPVLAYIDSVGASGAYMAALPADKILAYDTSIVGSIGVISEHLNFSELLKEHGVKQVQLTRGKYKGVPSEFGDVNEELVSEVLGPILDQAFEGFKEDVLRFRSSKLKHSSDPEFSEFIANGKPFTGLQGVELGLVDEVITSKKDAKLQAIKMAGFEDYAEVKAYEKQTFLDLLSDTARVLGAAFSEGFFNRQGHALTVN